MSVSDACLENEKTYTKTRFTKEPAMRDDLESFMTVTIDTFKNDQLKKYVRQSDLFQISTLSEIHVSSRAFGSPGIRSRSRTRHEIQGLTTRGIRHETISLTQSLLNILISG